MPGQASNSCAALLSTAAVAGCGSEGRRVVDGRKIHVRQREQRVRRQSRSSVASSGVVATGAVPGIRAGWSAGAESSGPLLTAGGVDGRVRPARGAVGRSAGGFAGYRARKGRPAASAAVLWPPRGVCRAGAARLVRRHRTANGRAGRAGIGGPVARAASASRPRRASARRSRFLVGLPAVARWNDFSLSGLSGLGHPQPAGNGRQQVG